MEPRERIEEFLRQYVGQRGLDVEIVATIWTDPQAAPAQLTAHDLRAVIAEVKALRAAVEGHENALQRFAEFRERRDG